MKTMIMLLFLSSNIWAGKILGMIPVIGSTVPLYYATEPTLGFEHILNAQKRLEKAQQLLTHTEKLDRIRELKAQINLDAVKSTRTKEEVLQFRKIIAEIEKLQGTKSFDEFQKEGIIRNAKEDLRIQLMTRMKWGRKFLLGGASLGLLGYGVWELVKKEEDK